MLMKNLKKILPEPIYLRLVEFYNNHLLDYSTKTYSQEGEDLILRKLFYGKEKGFYIDVGAHHPKRFSNTYYFYKKGWRGINIEARPGSKKLFDKLRPRDTNIEKAISCEPKDLKYYMFNDPALNGFNEENMLRLKDHPKYKLIDTKIIKTTRLDVLLKEVISTDQQIDFMSIDVEELDYDVLKSNDWNLFRPKIILVEDPNYNFQNGSEISVFLESNNYKIFAKTFNTCFYSRNN